MGKKGSGWFSSVKKVFKQSPKDSPDKKVSSISFEHLVYMYFFDFSYLKSL